MSIQLRDGLMQEPCQVCMELYRNGIHPLPPCSVCDETPFWKNVRELAAMREDIPPERRAESGSGVRAAIARDVKEYE